MPAAVIMNYLQADVLDRSAAAVIAANPPGTFINGVSSVPSYLYLSLKTLWTSASGGIPAYQALVTADLGTGKSSPLGSIVVVSEALTEQVLDRTSLYSDAPGAEVTPIQILLYKPRAQSTSVTLIQNTQLRIRYLLDNYLRGVQGLSGNLPVSAVYADPSIDPRSPFFCFYERNLEPILASEANILFSCDYLRLFTK